MNGTMLVFAPGGPLDEPPMVVPLDGPGEDNLDKISAALGHDAIELMPRFTSIEIGGHLCVCVAFCGEHSKEKPEPINRRATILWGAAVTRTGENLQNPDGSWKDYVAGPMVVLFGDREFMESL